MHLWWNTLVKANGYGTTTLGWREATTVQYVTWQLKRALFDFVSRNQQSKRYNNRYSRCIMVHPSFNDVDNSRCIQCQTCKTLSEFKISFFSLISFVLFSSKILFLHLSFRPRVSLAKAIEALQEEGFQRVLLYGCSILDAFWRC